MSFICCNVLIASGQNSIIDTVKTVSIESITEKYNTLEPGWENIDGTWAYNGKLMDTVPVYYTIHKEIVKIDSLGGQLKSKHCFFESEEISIKCETSAEGWSWKDNKWFFEGKNTNSFPPNYILIRERNKTVSDSDCLYENSPSNTLYTKTMEKEYYVIENNDWQWNTQKRTWQHKDKSLKKEVTPSYKRFKTEITTSQVH